VFYVTPNVLRNGQAAQLCYSRPALKPAKTTKRMLTAENDAGVKVTATTEASIGTPSARNARSWKLSAGQGRTPPTYGINERVMATVK